MTNQTNYNKSFVLHVDSLDVLTELSDQQAGKLFKSIYNYQKTGKYTKLDQLLTIIINPLINQFKRDEEKYQNSILKGKLGNLKKYHKKIYQQVIEGKITLENAENLAYPEKLIKSTISRPPITPDTQGSYNVNINIPISINDNESNNENIEDETPDIYKELAEGLKFILEAKLNRKITTTMNWQEEIRKLVENDLKPRDNALEDTKAAIQAVAEHYGKEYFPVIQSASALREKFTKIENYLQRNKPKKSVFDVE